MAEYIRSFQNPKIKQLVQHGKPSVRKETGLFTIEGLRECQRALTCGYMLDTVFYAPEVGWKECESWVKGLSQQIKIVEVSKELFGKVAYRENSDGIIAMAHTLNHPISNLSAGINPLMVVLESVEKPGNLGAILRTADAVGADALIICDPQTDIYNPNVIRASLGCLFSVPLAVCTSTEAVQFLKANHIKIFVAALSPSSIHYSQVDYREPSALVMGSEAHGLSQYWLENSDQVIQIPMKGVADSLNVSTATAILAYEALRQRESSF